LIINNFTVLTQERKDYLLSVVNSLFCRYILYFLQNVPMLKRDCAVLKLL